MDPAVLGSLIGVGLLACLGCTVALQDKVTAWWSRWRQQKQPLLPTAARNPVLLKPRKTQWKVQQLLDLK